jgi:hypothetical protein
VEATGSWALPTMRGPSPGDSSVFRETGVPAIIVTGPDGSNAPSGWMKSSGISGSAAGSGSTAVSGTMNGAVTGSGTGSGAGSGSGSGAGTVAGTGTGSGSGTGTGSGSLENANSPWKRSARGRMVPPESRKRSAGCSRSVNSHSRIFDGSSNRSRTPSRVST